MADLFFIYLFFFPPFRLCVIIVHTGLMSPKPQRGPRVQISNGIRQCVYIYLYAVFLYCCWKIMIFTPHSIPPKKKDFKILADPRIYIIGGLRHSKSIRFHEILAVSGRANNLVLSMCNCKCIVWILYTAYNPPNTFGTVTRVTLTENTIFFWIFCSRSSYRNINIDSPFPHELYNIIGIHIKINIYVFIYKHWRSH